MIASEPAKILLAPDAPPFAARPRPLSSPSLVVCWDYSTARASNATTLATNPRTRAIHTHTLASSPHLLSLSPSLSPSLDVRPLTRLKHRLNNNSNRTLCPRARGTALCALAIRAGAWGSGQCEFVYGRGRAGGGDVSCLLCGLGREERGRGATGKRGSWSGGEEGLGLWQMQSTRVLTEPPFVQTRTLQRRDRGAPPPLSLLIDLNRPADLHFRLALLRDTGQHRPSRHRHPYTLHHFLRAFLVCPSLSLRNENAGLTFTRRSGFVKERLYVGEAIIATCFGIAFS